ncbi:MAG: PKD domain-containing protein [Planctomycetota bacterium]
MIALFAGATSAHAQTLVWSDEFDGPMLDRTMWTFNAGNHGFGNGELQYHTARPENIYMENGNLVIEARDEDYLATPFTSSRVTTLGRFAFRYGRLEARIKLPDLDNGLWPAFWLLGNDFGQLNWPACGEIDVMEAGRKDGFLAGVVNRRVSAAAHWELMGEPVFYSEFIDHTTDLYNDYHIFSMEWTPTEIRMLFDDVHYYTIDISNPEADSLEELHTPMAILTNVSVGGWNFIEITDPDQITAPFPAKMYVDYIRLYDDGDTELFFGEDLVESGSFGIYTETTPVENSVEFDLNASLLLWNNLTEVTGTAYEGTDAWHFSANPGEWFGMGVLSDVDRNMRDYSDGNLNFHMKTISTAPFKIGVKSSAAGESWVAFEEGVSDYGLQRDGNWHAVSVPLNRFLNVDFTTINQLFMIAGDPPPGPFSFSIDNIYWTPSVPRPTPENGNFGIFTEDPTHKTSGEYELGVNGEFYIWENTLLPGAQDPFEGAESMSLNSAPGLDWFGAAFTPDIKYNLTAFRFPESRLHLAMRTSSTVTFYLGMRSGNVNDIGQKWIRFENGNDPYGFVRDGQWHVIEIPMGDLADAVDLFEVSMLFEVLGVNGPIGNIEFDDVCLLGGGDALPIGEGIPIANAGANQVVVLPDNSVIVDGSGSQDDGTIVAFHWSQISGPSSASLDGENSAVLTASDLVEGTYVFRLTVTDDEDLTDHDDVSITVTTGTPTAHAGSDQSIALPQNSVTLAGSGTDVDGVIETYAWSQVSGPNTAMLMDNDTANATASDLIEGFYVFQLTVTDDDDLTGSDEVMIEVSNEVMNVALGKPASASSEAGGSLAANGGFESGSGTDADNWSLLEFPAGSSTATTDRVATIPNSGTWHLQMSVMGAGNGGPATEAQQLTPTGSVTPGNSYDLEVHLRRIGAIGPGVVAQVAVQWLDSDGSHGGGVKGTTGFMHVEGSLTESYAPFGFKGAIAAADSDAALIILRLAGGAFDGSDGQMAADDVSLISASPNISGFAVDGDYGTRWASLDGDPQWLEIALGDRYEISQVVLDWADAYSREYDIDVSEDGVVWETVYATTTGAGGMEEIDLVAAGRFIRLYAHVGDTPNGCSLYEFEAYGQFLGGQSIPTTTHWGLVAMMLLLLTTGTLVYDRRQRGRMLRHDG